MREGEEIEQETQVRRAGSWTLERRKNGPLSSFGCMVRPRLYRVSWPLVSIQFLLDIASSFLGFQAWLKIGSEHVVWGGGLPFSVLM